MPESRVYTDRNPGDEGWDHNVPLGAVNEARRTFGDGHARDGSKSVRHWYGLVDGTVNGTAGLAWVVPGPPGQVPDEAKSISSWGSYVSWGIDKKKISSQDESVVFAHEVGHNRGQFHADGCRNPDRVDPGFEEAGNPGGKLKEVGFDVEVGQAVPPVTERTLLPDIVRYDIMSYCDDIWITAYTYKDLIKCQPSSVSPLQCKPSSTRTPPTRNCSQVRDLAEVINTRGADDPTCEEWDEGPPSNRGGGRR